MGDNDVDVEELVDKEVREKLDRKFGWQKVSAVLSVIIPLVGGVWWVANNIVTKEALAEERQVIEAGVASRILAVERELLAYKIESVTGYIEYLEDRVQRGEANDNDHRLLKYNQRRLDRLLRQEQVLGGRDR